jgi:hypothetical protein
MGKQMSLLSFFGIDYIKIIIAMDVFERTWCDISGGIKNSVVYPALNCQLSYER